jgi:SAM-dependent methyltransferase
MSYKIKNSIRNSIPSGLLNLYISFKRKQTKKRLKKEFAGDNVYCNICNSKYREFAPYGKENRRNAYCLNCGAVERHRLIWSFLNERTDLFKKKKLKVLHFAPEKVFYDRLSNRENIEYYSVDLFPELYQYKGKVPVSKADITSIPFQNNYFDNHVLEHIPDDKLAMSEMYRVLKKGGWSIFQVPIDYSREMTYEDFTITDPAEREKAFGQHDHVRWYGKDYKDRLASVGFSVDENDFVKTFQEDEIFKLGFNKNELLYYCTVK